MNIVNTKVPYRHNVDTTDCTNSLVMIWTKVFCSDLLT